VAVTKDKGGNMDGVKRLTAALVASIFLVFQAVLPALAESDDAAVLKQEIAALKQEIKALSDRLAASEERIHKVETSKTEQAPQASLPAVKAESGIEKTVTDFAREIQVHGFVDTSYIFNSNTPVSPNSRTNNLRLFDNEANGFMLNMTQLSFEKPISKESPVGFRVKLDAGQDAKLIHSNGLGSSGDEFDLEEAFAQVCVPYSLPYMYEVKFFIGKYATLQGAEVIESVNDWNFSRSFLFSYAIPFTHTGIRAYYKPFENIPVDAYIGVVNGWDDVVDNNRAKTIEAELNYYATDKLSFTANGIFGPERSDSDKDFRNVIDLVATYQATDKLTLKANYDYGWEKNGMSASAGLPSDKDAYWDGIAGYIRYAILDWWAISGRVEYFHDANAVRTLMATSSTMPMTDVQLFEYTLTNEFTIYKNLIARLEYRYDKGSGQVFTKDKLTSNYQNTFAAEFIAKF